MPDKQIWPEVRAVAEKNVEQARTAYGQFMDLLTQALETSSKVAPNALPPGFRAVHARSIDFARENAERFFTLESELVRAKDVHEMLTLQSAYVHAQIKAHAQQAQELAGLIAAAMPRLSRTIAIP